MHLDISQEQLYARITGKMPRPRSGKSHATDFVRAGAVKMHMGIAQEPFYAKIDRKKAGDQMEHPDLTPASPTVRTPQCEHTAWGKTEQPQKQKDIPLLESDQGSENPSLEHDAPIET